MNLLRAPMAHILLIEDNPASRRGIQEMLEVLGHQVTAAPDGLRGLEALRALPDVSLVLTDIMMPVMDGISVLRQLQKDRPGLAVIAMTGRHDSSYLATAERLGARATLFKPFTLQELSEGLRSS